MKKTLRRVLLGLFTILGLFLLYVGVVVVHGTINDYQPPAEEPTRLLQTGERAVITDSVLTFLIWNIGYAGLGEESDFFYEKSSLTTGGMMVRPSKEISRKNFQGVTEFLRNVKADFYLLQEVDKSSRRSYRLDQAESLAGTKPGYYAGFAANYQVARVPVPVLEPWKAYGKVESGLATFSRYQPTEAIRYQLPGNYSWPTRIFMLDRCAAVHRYPLPDGKELVVVNIHNSAYDDGSLKAQQMAFLREFFEAEYAKGNYLIAGGDWNQCPPFFRFDGFMPGQGGDYHQTNVDPDFLPADWKWIYDPTVPTNRKVSEPYTAGSTFVTLIDFFLVSPNVQVNQVKGLDQRFRFSDHQPVYMEIMVKSEGGNGKSEG